MGRLTSEGIIALVILPIAAFTALMLLYPSKAAAIFGIEILSPIPPIP